MSICEDCEANIQFRTIAGTVVPLGCRCDPDREFYHERSETTKRTSCPKCRAHVYFVRYNGGCVWLDELGHPWPEHACFEGDHSTPLPDKFAGEPVEDVGKITHLLLSDANQHFIRVSFPEEVIEFKMPADFWSLSNGPQPGDSLGINRESKFLVRHCGRRFRYKVVHLKHCNRCGELFLSWQRHKGRCSAS